MLECHVLQLQTQNVVDTCKGPLPQKYPSIYNSGYLHHTRVPIHIPGYPSIYTRVPRYKGNHTLRHLYTCYGAPTLMPCA